ncbi:unnamed protein product [Adineta ricciae]|uniref:Uncharacterized protein n=1 Tax=Adineta ricciae TaxID=249248 RepID=A0A816AJN9_ADIRI|nr:unnamed protein product [Adineta ricciae]
MGRFPLIVQEIPLHLFSHSIRSLQFQNACCSINKTTTYFTTNKCYDLIHSPLGIHCEFLSLNVQKRTSILDLVHGLPNLRTLKVFCEDDQWGHRTATSSGNDELIQWLETRLSCVISRDKRFKTFIRLWIL